MLWFLAQGGNPNPGGGGFSPQWIRYAIWAIIIGITVLSWLMRFIAQKRQEAQAKAARRRREEEVLRTGRSEDGSPVSTTAHTVLTAGPAGHDEARRRLQEIAQRRRAELEQMARQQQPRQAPPAVAPPMARPAPAVARPARQPAPSRPAPSVPTTQRPVRQDQRRKKQPAPRPVPPPPPPREVAPPQPQPAVHSAYAIAPPPPGISSAPSGPVVARRGPKVSVEAASTPTGRENLRRALIFAEVLAPPLSMRDEAAESGMNPVLQRPI